MYTFSMTCKVDAVTGSLANESSRVAVCDWMKSLGISKTYLETYRHGHFVDDESLLRDIRDYFMGQGFKVGGCITPTMLGRTVENWPVTTCFTDPASCVFFEKIAQHAAGLFDEIIIDDFFFTVCTCHDCEAHRAGRSWGEARGELMCEVARRHLIGPAHEVNPDVKIIVKYPCWYEGYFGKGYDIVGLTELFDATWIGTETREPTSSAAGRRPQTAASWIQGWANDFSHGKCGGGWFDPIDTGDLTFVEQARQTILGGARESLLHCLDYLGTDNPGIVIHGKDTNIANGKADAEAFRQEMPLLRKLAEIITKLEPEGVLAPKKPNDDPVSEIYVLSFLAMLGIPVLPAASLKPDAVAAFLALQASGFEDLHEFVSSLRASGRPFVVTSTLVSRFPEFADGAAEVLRLPDDLWELMQMPTEALESLRAKLLKPLGVSFTAISRISLHLFRGESGRLAVIENFNDAPVRVSLRIADMSSVPAVAALALPEEKSVSEIMASAGILNATLAPRSLGAFWFGDMRGNPTPIA